MQTGRGPSFSTLISSQLNSLTTSAKMTKGMIVKNMSIKVGKTLTVVGVPKPDATHFEVNVGPNEGEIALHMNPRFNALGDENTVVYNSYQGDTWGEEFREGGFPFKQGKEFEIKIEVTPEEFLVTLPDGSKIQFPNRMGMEKYSFMSFKGDVHIISVEVK
ncbi:lectin, galactoside-binding, soluble, 2a [Xiphias gladius]|uniref:lectin, galactoside-binding, soluble, 2a n=1 Tax=Xiphias gladius TaxID=8245 RepID=UPI001A988192|nr:lectin, galactoside-binding, soluble, 2a [Xiphias gladius]